MTRFTSAKADRWIADIDKQIAQANKFLDDSHPILLAAKGGRYSRLIELRSKTKDRIVLLREERALAETVRAEFK